MVEMLSYAPQLSTADLHVLPLSRLSYKMRNRSGPTRFFYLKDVEQCAATERCVPEESHAETVNVPKTS